MRRTASKSLVTVSQSPHRDVVVKDAKSRLEKALTVIRFNAAVMDHLNPNLAQIK